MPAAAEDVVASAPSALSVTVYRAPDRDAGSIDLDDLGGFALISETRTVHLPAGVTRLRFEGVADGIDAATAILTGLPGAVIEKNRDAALLRSEEHTSELQSLMRIQFAVLCLQKNTTQYIMPRQRNSAQKT